MSGETPLVRYTELAPTPALTPWVACFWSIRGYGAGGLANRVLPDGCSDVIVGIENDPRPVVVGTMRTAVLVPMAGPVDLFGVRFRPGGGFPFLDTPLNELTDRRLLLDELWGRSAEQLGDAFRSALLEQRVARAERALRDRLGRQGHAWERDAELVARAVSLLRRARGGVGVRQVAAALGVGERRLERGFDRVVGLSPKTLGRVMRFREAVRQIERQGGSPSAQWASVAFGAGYADQSHLIREFKALAGVTPARFAVERQTVGFVQYGQEEVG
jgi:AraC-like DNA-binding protein